MPLEPDAELRHADWLRGRTRWPLPPYKSKEFMAILQSVGVSLEQFRQLPLYHEARRRGWITDDDEWAGPGNGDGGR